MFTGLIEHLGTIKAIDRDDGGCTLTVSNCAEILGDCHIGDSIAVNGACLTVTEFDANKENDGGWFKVWLAHETLDKTEFGERKAGDPLNLERAMGAHSRFGGHFVQAHVDDTAIIMSIDPDGESVRIVFKFLVAAPQRAPLLKYIVPKGYITLDGASLTVTHVDDEQRTFGVMLIKHTQERITLGRKEAGDRVNVEVDALAKYVEKSVWAAFQGEGGEQMQGLIEKAVEKALTKRMAQ